MNLIVLTAVLFYVVSCTKEGPAGQNGTTNSLVYNTTATWSYSASTATYYYGYSCLGLTQNNIDNGAVPAYTSFTASNWVPLPVEVGNARYSFTFTTNLI